MDNNSLIKLLKKVSYNYSVKYIKLRNKTKFNFEVIVEQEGDTR